MTKFAIVALAFLLAADATIDFSCNCSNCVEEPFKEHVNSFENEARLRRVKACVCDVTMVADTSIYSLNDDGFVIQCAALTIDTARIILVDTTSNNWILNPESLIYHELGHLILLRNDEVEMFNDDFLYAFSNVTHDINP